jgi:hypothetical protein
LSLRFRTAIVDILNGPDNRSGTLPPFISLIWLSDWESKFYISNSMWESQIFKIESRKKFFGINIMFSFLNLENFVLVAFALHAGIVAKIIWYFLEFSNFKGYRTICHGYEFQYCICYMFLIGFKAFSVFMAWFTLLWHESRNQGSQKYVSRSDATNCHEVAWSIATVTKKLWNEVIIHQFASYEILC